MVTPNSFGNLIYFKWNDPPVGKLYDTNGKLFQNGFCMTTDQFQQVFANQVCSDLVNLVSKSSDDLCVLQLFTESTVYKKLLYAKCIQGSISPGVGRFNHPRWKPNHHWIRKKSCRGSDSDPHTTQLALQRQVLCYRVILQETLNLTAFLKKIKCCECSLNLGNNLCTVLGNQI